ncbi:MAG: 50S ribosomal protein L4 [Candidatus Sungbacteria bacterium]|nr:50S ribosomal protein L4 [Candidatus Sungbacteria bacterium]
MKLKTYNQEGKETGTMELPDAVFGLKWNGDLVHQVVMGQLANRRAGTAHAKTRGEVRGGGKKPWRQKGTGRARHGSIRSPIWIGGGVAHGPRSDKNYTKKINKKMAKKALFTVLSAKARDNELVVVDAIHFPEEKTKHAASFVKSFATQDAFQKIVKGKGMLLALSASAKGIKRAFRNLPYAETDEARNLYAAEVLKFRYIVMPREVIEVFKK